MRQSISVTREALRRLFFQRCFYLFITLLALVAIAPFIDPSPRGGVLLRSLINAFVILAAVAAVGRSILSFMTVLFLAAPALVFRWLSIKTERPLYLDLSLRLDVAVYATAIAFLLRYVFAREVMTGDRLWGAASAYLMIGVLWSFLYAIVDRASPDSFAVRGS
ncbi:MAG: voltage-gated potassium channel, partial [Lysobacterales bacterium]